MSKTVFADGFYGRLMVVTAAATDSYAEAGISFPNVGVQAGSKQSLVPIIKAVELQWIGSLATISADAQLAANVYNIDTTTISALPTSGIADAWTIVDWRQANALTTSGEVIIQNNYRWDAPGDGMILLNPYLTVVQSNTATGISLVLGARVWYEYASMPTETYLLMLHSV